MNESLELAILDIQETFPRVTKIISAWQLNAMNHGEEQTKWEYELFTKFSEAMKVIQETEVENEESHLISAQLIQETDVDEE